MKKSLFALAAVGAFAGAAQAQSSVTVYGILDVGYTGGNTRDAGTSTVTKSTVNRISNSMESGSRLGFRGNEDLGGGTSAQFVFELGIQPAGNAGSNSNGATGTGTSQTVGQGTGVGQGSANWNPNVRQAFVGLTQKGLGTMRIGTQNSLFWEQAGSNTTGQLSQTLGSILAPSTDGAFFSAPATALSTSGSALGAYTARTTNTINFRTERIAGIMGKASYTMSNQNSTYTGLTGNNGGYSAGPSNQSGWQLAFDANIQKANIQGSYAVFTSQGPYSVTGTAMMGTNTYTSNSPASWGSGTQGTNIKDSQMLFTASYDFGIFRAYAGWTQRQLAAYYNDNVQLKRQAQEIGVRGYATKTIEYWGSVGNGKYVSAGTGLTTFTTTGNSVNISAFQLGSNYWMSKRTNLYAIYGTNNTSTTSSGVAANINQYSLGVRHTF